MIFGDLHTGHGLLFQQGFRKIFGLNQLGRPEHNSPLHGVFQFANIPGPVVLDQAFARLRGNALY